MNDNSVVMMVSNCQLSLEMAKRWPRADKKPIDITQPFVIDQYSRNMGGVDRVDHNISTYMYMYHISIRSQKC